MSNNNLNPHLELPPPSPQQFASVYPKVPTQEELPSYNAAMQYSNNMPQPSNSQQQQPYPYPQQQQYQPGPYPQQHQQPYPYPQQQQQQPIMYGSISPPNLHQPPQTNSSTGSIQPLTGLKTQSELVQCPHCHQFVYTVIDYESGLCTGLSVGGLFFAGCHSGACLLPFLFPWTKDVSHTCPSCKQKIATFTRLERDTRITASPL